MRLEPELVHDVVFGVAVIVDVELVQDVVPEFVEVGTAGRRLERDPVRDQRDRVGCVGAHKGIDIRIVRERVRGDERRLAMARGDRQKDRPEHQSRTHDVTH